MTRLVNRSSIDRGMLMELKDTPNEADLCTIRCDSAENVSVGDELDD